MRGIPWGLTAMALYGVYVWAAGPVSKALGSVRLTMTAHITTALVLIATNLLSNGGQAPDTSSSALGWIVVLVLVSTVAPYFVMMEGIRRLGSSEASLLAMVSPVSAAVASWAMLGETMNLIQILGVLLVLVGVGWTQERKIPA